MKRKQLEQFSPRTKTEWFEHFIFNSIPGGTNYGTGGTNTFLAVANASGVVRTATGATATGGFGFRYNPSIFHPGNTGEFNYRLSFRWRVPFAPSTTEAFVACFGIGNPTTPVEPPTGFYFYVDNGGRIYATTSNAGTRTYQDFGDFTHSTWLESAIIMARDNSVTYQTQLTGNDSFVQHTIRDPVAINTTTAMGLFISILKQTGTTNRFLETDYISLDIDREFPFV